MATETKELVRVSFYRYAALLPGHARFSHAAWVLPCGLGDPRDLGLSIWFCFFHVIFAFPQLVGPPSTSRYDVPRGQGPHQVFHRITRGDPAPHPSPPLPNMCYLYRSYSHTSTHTNKEGHAQSKRRERTTSHRKAAVRWQFFE